MATEDLISVDSPTTTNITEHKPTKQSFIDADLLELPPASAKLLESYSHIPSDELLPHVIQVRDRAWKISPYPCIGHYRFLDLALPRSPAYAEIIERLRKGSENLVDVGCGVGQEIRGLVADGAPAENLYGVDIHGELFGVGYELFRDSGKLNSLFVEGDVLSPEGTVAQLEGRMSMVWTSGLLHLFGWKNQVAATVRMLKLLRKGPNVVIAGRIMGKEEAGEEERRGEADEVVYRHNIKSFKKMFHEACDIVGEAWETDVTATLWKENMKLDNTSREVPQGLVEVEFVARRLERVDGATSHTFVF